MILNDVKIKYKEVDIQESIQKLLSNPVRIWNSIDNKRFKILSSGFINPYEGPDLKNVSIYYDGKVVTGDAEIDLKSSNWYYHNHFKSSNFDKVILHIVLENDKQVNSNFLTLLIDPNEMVNKNKKAKRKTVSADDLIVIQEYSLFRLERLSKNFENHYSENKSINHAIQDSIHSFVKNYYNKRRRKSVYTQVDYFKIIDAVSKYLQNNDFSDKANLHSKLNNFLELAYPGAGLKNEILVNALLPSLYFISDEKPLILDWFYKAIARNIYGKLKLRFPHIPQKYIWQQQGMLELIKSSGEEQFIIKDIHVKYSLN